MNVVLVMANNFQEYILDNIEMLIKSENTRIFVLTDTCFFHLFEKYNTYVTLISIENLHDTYNYTKNSSLDNTFRNGFWQLTSKRFFYIYEFMKQYSIEDVIHIENDVLIYYNCDVLKPKFNENLVYIPFDTLERNICSIMYIPNHNIFKMILDKYDFTKNDMYNFSIIMKKTNLINNFPICFNPSRCNNPDVNFVTRNFQKFKIIFDAAAIGQYLGGIDPKNDPNNTIGFVNETCIIKYNHPNFNIQWKKCENNIEKPFLNNIPIFNLHIHSKNLKQFIRY